MFHADSHQQLENIEEVTSIREGQPMQPMDEQSFEQPATNGPSYAEGQEEQVQSNRQEAQLAQKGGQAEENQAQPGAQLHDYQAASEQISLASAPTFYPSTPAAYSAGAETQPQPVIHSTTPEPMWAYPPHPGHYQSAPSAQPFGTVGAEQAGQPGAPAAFAPAQATSPFVTPVQPKRSGLRTGTLLALLVLLAVVFGTGLFAGWQFGRTGTSPTGSGVFQPGSNSSVAIPQLNGNNADAVREAVINKVQPGVVQINVVSTSQRALGSGVIIDGRGYIVTNNHVVANASSIQVTLADSSTFSAQVVGSDPADDLALIKITPPASGLSVVNFADSSRLRAGQEVLAIGSPLGNTETVTRGIVSALNRTISEGQNGPTIPDAIQTDAPINPGNSGGALVDMQGNLVGIPTLNAIDTEFNTPANGLGFAIPSNRVKFIAQQLITTGHVTHTGRAILGVGVTTVDQNLAARAHLGTTSGVLVESVSAGGPAAAAHMQTGDVIVKLNNTTIHNTADLSRALLQHKPDETVALKIYRGGQPLTLNVTLSELPAS